MEALGSHDGMSAMALRFIILTGCRSGEGREAVWGEIDLDKAVWTIPGKRMKGGVLHRIPLPKPALKVLRHLILPLNRTVVNLGLTGALPCQQTLPAKAERSAKLAGVGSRKRRDIVTALSLDGAPATAIP